MDYDASFKKSEHRLVFDLVVIGGGINGTGIARDAAGRGLKVCLLERDDLAQHTSSASTKLIHGGLRYLEHYDFLLVRKALIEREVIMRIAPQLTWPLRFVVPHVPEMRPTWMMKAGLFLYDHLARREILPGSESIRFREHVTGGPLRPEFLEGFIYSDGWVDDARLVILNAMDAAEHGAIVRTRTAVVGATRMADAWLLKCAGKDTGLETIQARAVVNAAGPWVTNVLRGALGQPAGKALRLVKGSHIVIPRLYDHAYAYLLQNHDQRVIFTIPYEDEFTLVGTTDIEIQSEADEARVSEDEVKYLCAAVNRYFKRDIQPAQVVHRFCGVRPLLDDSSGRASEVTRDYSLELDTSGAPLVSVFGGKITTYRKLAEEVLAQLKAHFKLDLPAWTDAKPLPGGNIGYGAFHRFMDDFARDHPWLDERTAKRLCRAYGTRLLNWFPINAAEAGTPLAKGVYVAELNYVYQHEWARSADDFLWRRSKLGLHLNGDEVDQIHRWFSDRRSANLSALQDQSQNQPSLN